MPKELEILTHPHPGLRQKSKALNPTEVTSHKFQEFLQDLEETMLKKDGAGLAAPQVGQNIRVIAVRHENQTLFFINPKITKKSWAKEIEEEGCLSVLDAKGEIIYAPVSRYKRITCLYFDQKGQPKKISAEKLLARILQHEIDHLDGILFIDKIEKRLKRVKIKNAVVSASQA